MVSSFLEWHPSQSLFPHQLKIPTAPLGILNMLRFSELHHSLGPFGKYQSIRRSDLPLMSNIKAVTIMPIYMFLPMHWWKKIIKWKFKLNSLFTLRGRCGDPMIILLVPEQVVQVWAGPFWLLRFWARHFTHSLSLPSYILNSVPVNQMLDPDNSAIE